ncbi:MAG: divalent metal cation transporter, partial [Candidatus Palauibacterales bacterium]|nr:divalent metal cation transporter [Candidatus Palauibacterales bacterium]
MNDRGVDAIDPGPDGRDQGGGGRGRESVTVRIRGFLREYLTPSVLLPYLGPAFIVSVGYMDPGNWATDISGGAEFGYKLLWVLLWSNIFAIFLQT